MFAGTFVSARSRSAGAHLKVMTATPALSDVAMLNVPLVKNVYEREPGMCVDWLVSPVVDPPGPIVSMPVLAPWAGAENATLSVSPRLNELSIEVTDGIGV